MSNPRLNALAQRLRSDNLNERLVAASKVESITGMTMNAIIKAGTPRVVSGNAAGWILDHAQIKSGDDLILSVGSELAGLQVDWSDLVDAGARPKTSSSSEDFEAAFKGIFDSFFAAAEQRRRTQQAAQQPQPAPQPTVIRVNRDQLPVSATGIPRVTRQGKARTGQAYAVVSFREFTAIGGQRMKPMTEFIAFGDAWVEKILAAEAAGEDINIGFANVDQIGKLPQIKEVR